MQRRGIRGLRVATRDLRRRPCEPRSRGPLERPMCGVRCKLSVMMVLEVFIWGAWLPLIFGYLPSLGFAPGEQAWILNSFTVAALIALFFSTQFAARTF